MPKSSPTATTGEWIAHLRWDGLLDLLEEAETLGRATEALSCGSASAGSATGGNADAPQIWS